MVKVLSVNGKIPLVDGKAISATGGGGGSTSIAMRVEGGYIQYSTDNGKTWVNLIAEADLKGDKGDPGTPGKDGAGMDITGATVGQIAKITAVDASGVPTAWSPVDMPSGGGDETPIDTISEGTLSEDVANIVIDGFSKRSIALATIPYGSTANSGTIKISLKFGLDSGDVLTFTPNFNFVTNTAAVSWNKIVVFASVDNGIFDTTIYRDGASISGDIYINNSVAANLWIAKSVYIGAKKITSVTIGLQADGVIGKNTVYKVVGR